MNSPHEISALTVAPRQQFDLSPQTFEQALTFSKYLAESEMVPKQFRNKPGDCLIAMQWGYEVNFKPLQALQSIAVINGKPGIYGDAGKAILLAAGCIIEEDDTEVIKATGRGRCKITRPGRPPCERTFSIEDAKTANLWSKEGPWRTYPHRQMAWRAFWFAARDCASDLLRGMAGVEELGDFSVKSMGAAEVVGAQSAPPSSPNFYNQADFDKNLPAWEKQIVAGKLTADDVIQRVQTKAPLTDAQKEKILSIKRAAPSDVIDVEAKVGPTYAQIAERINTAPTHDDLDALDEIIGAVTDAQQRSELVALVDQRRNELPAF